MLSWACRAKFYASSSLWYYTFFRRYVCFVLTHVTSFISGDVSSWTLSPPMVFATTTLAFLAAVPSFVFTVFRTRPRLNPLLLASGPTKCSWGEETAAASLVGFIAWWRTWAYVGFSTREAESLDSCSPGQLSVVICSWRGGTATASLVRFFSWQRTWAYVGFLSREAESLVLSGLRAPRWDLLGPWQDGADAAGFAYTCYFVSATLIEKQNRNIDIRGRLVSCATHSWSERWFTLTLVKSTRRAYSHVGQMPQSAQSETLKVDDKNTLSCMTFGIISAQAWRDTSEYARSRT